MAVVCTGVNLGCGDEAIISFNVAILVLHSGLYGGMGQETALLGVVPWLVS